MPFTPEDITRIQAAIQSGNYAQDADLQTLTGLGLVLRTEADHATYVGNLTAQLRDEIIASEELPAYRNIEAALEKHTGVKKNEGEKASEYLARIVGPMKEQLTAYQAEIDALKKDNPDDARVQTLIAERDQLKQSYEQQVAEAQGKLIDYRRQQELSAVEQAAKNRKLAVDELGREDVIANRLRLFQEAIEIRFDAEGNRQTWDKKENKRILDPTTLKDVEPASQLSRFFSDIDAKDTGGTGTEPSKTPLAVKSNYAEAKTRTQLMEMLAKDGYTTDSKEHAQHYLAAEKAYTEANGRPLPIREL